MTAVRPWVTSWLLAAALLVLWPPPAHACSCAVQDPQQALAAADAAFVGTLTDQRGDRWVFDVDAVLAGELATPLLVQAAVGDGANCGLTPEPGATYALILYREADGRLSSNGCLQYDPETLLEAGTARGPTPGEPVDAGTDTGASSSGGGGLPVIVGSVLGGLAILGATLRFGRARR